MQTKISDLASSVTALWAKSDDASGHPLLLHMLDVAAVAETLLEREPEGVLDWLSVQFGFRPTYAVPRWCAALVGLHDFGKACPGFQAKWPEGQRMVELAGLRFSEAAKSRNRHDIATAALLKTHLNALGIDREWTSGVLQAISAHHGFNLQDYDISNGRPLNESPEWHEARQALFEHYWRVLAPQGLPSLGQLALPAVEWLAGFTSVCDWIGSNTDWFPFGSRATTLEAHYAEARRRANAALDAIGWPVFAPLLDDATGSTDVLLTRILGRDATVAARPLQAVADRLLGAGHGPALMVIEAPMGEGKTELAFLSHLRLQARNRHRGLYVALPTQATGNAMFDRTVVFLRAFASDLRLDIQLAHGGAELDERVARLRNVWDSEGNDAVSSSAWFSRRRRALLSPYGVGTVDQALFSSLNVKHHFVRLWGLANKVVVLDEVHAYDTYTTGLIESLLRWLKALGCSVVLMSATLPASKRRDLLEAWGIREEPPALAYPRVLIADAAGLRGESFEARKQEPIRVAGIAEGIDVLAAHALALLEQGGCGAVIVNTVDRAQKLYRQLRECVPEGVPLLLFHARYPANERQERERQVLRLFGAPDQGADRPQRALLIATQVAEQSLDIDFDFLLSDLAPIDLLLQRAGRLHRHVRPDRPAAHAVPRLLVAGLQPDRLPELKATAWGRIYGDYLCLVTWAVLRRESLWCLPLDIDRLVQAVYAKEPDLGDIDADQQMRIVETARIEKKAADNCARQMALNIALDAGEEVCTAYNGKPHGSDEDDCYGLRNRTRIGEDSVTVVPVHEDDAGLWHVRENSPGVDRHAAASDELARQLFARQLKLSRRAVSAALKVQPQPVLFSKHPLLAHLRPLPLRAGRCRCGKQVLHLDPELGLCYLNDSHQEQA
jgi:CRISPR-associated endonuclease/helicase Cas3